MTDRPDQFEGVITIEWPWGAHPAGEPLRGWSAAPRILGGEPITTASRITVHIDAQDVVWAELTMFADRDGRPLLSGDPVTDPGTDGGEILTGTFPFLVSGMTVREPPRA